MVEIRRRPLPRHGTDHDLKPLPSFPRFCLPARPLQCRQEEYRSGRATAQGFGRSTSWDKVFDAVEHVVTFGLEHRVLRQIDAIGVDEIQYAKGHNYLTLIYPIDLDVTRLL
jgi:hypothetical protein